MNAYSDRQHARDREYAEAWAKLTPRQRKQMAKAGIEGPELPVYQTGKQDQDAILTNSRESEEQMETSPEATIANYDVMDVLRRVLGELMAQNNIRLTLECLALVTGLSYEGSSMTDIAKRHGVTRAAVSKRCVEISEALGLPPSRAMRTLTARREYERRQHRVLNRNERFPSNVG